MIAAICNVLLPEISENPIYIEHVTTEEVFRRVGQNGAAILG